MAIANNIHAVFPLI